MAKRGSGSGRRGGSSIRAQADQRRSARVDRRAGRGRSAASAGVIEQTTGVRVPTAGLPLLTSTVGIAGYTAAMHHATAASPGAAALIASVHSLAGASLAALTWKHAGPKNKERRAATTATVAWHGGLATVLTAVGPIHWPGSVLWVAGSVVCGGYWVIRQWTRSIGREHDEQPGSNLLAVQELAALARAKVSGLKVDEHGTARAQLALPPGLSARRELAGVDEAVASLTDLPVTAVRIAPDPSSPRRATIEIETVDHLAAAEAWPGGSAPGESIAVPLRAARYSSGRPVLVNLTGHPDQPADHLMVTGMTGAGKTDGVVGMVADGLTRVDVNWLVLDTRKALQSYGFLAPYLWLESTESRAKAIMRRLNKVITDRTDYLGRKGMKDWRPGCGLNYLVVIIEEAYTLIADGKYDAVAFAARSAGISLISSIQRATYNTVSTDWRAQHGSFWCFGTQSSDDASYGLPEGISALVHPEAWGKSRPGYCYFGGTGIADEDAIRPARSYRVDQQRDEIASYISAWRHHLDITGDLDEVTAAAFGDLWTSRTIYPDPHSPAHAAAVAVARNAPAEVVTAPAAGNPASPGPASPVPSPAGVATAEDDQEAEYVAAEISDEQAALAEQLVDAAEQDLLFDLTADERAALGPILPADPALADTPVPDLDPDLTRDLSAALAALDPDSAAQPRRSHAAIRSAWLSWVAHQYEAGQTVLERVTAVAWAEQYQRSDAWVDKQLALLIEAGDARRHPDYRGVVVLERAPEDPFAALAGAAA